MNRAPKKNSTRAAPAWEQVILSAPDSPTLQVEFRFSPRYVENLFGPSDTPKLPATRSAFIVPDGETLVLSDMFAVNGTSVFVNAWLVPAKEADTYSLRVTLGPYIMPRKGVVTLYWDGNKYMLELNPGQMFFEDITPAFISRKNRNLPTHRFRLFFELDKSEWN